MSRVRTLASLRSDVRQRAKMENDDFVTDLEMTEYINEAHGSLRDYLTDCFGDEYFGKETTLTTVADTSTLALPADFYKISDVGLWWDVASSQRQRLERYQPNEAYLDAFDQGWAYGRLIKYRLRQFDLHFSPVPTSAYGLTLNYIPTTTRLVADADEMEGYNGWEAWVVWETVITCLAAEESNTDYAEAKLARIQKRIQDAADRDKSSPKRIQRKRHYRPRYFPRGY